ncbi:hypothetical protein B7P43_G02239 [Cryptotermes secundus]|uniref:Uncharacterized protein n=2 Tax=Cryptotermes secundus TaxID=105785 RepID=A0A2J7PNK5_9NEOP|nr:hypothetical protein B7P43_G02239 [Cryptotermes secundus]
MKLHMCLMVILFTSAFGAKEEKKKEKKDPQEKASVGKTEKRGVEELIYVPQGHDDHKLIGGYAGGYGYGDAGYELGGQHSLGLLGYGDHNLNPSSRIKSIVITKEVAIPVPQPYPVPVEKTIPYPVKVPVPVPVVKHYPVPVVKPYPVPVEKKVPYPVEKIVPYPVKVPVEVPVQVPHPVPVAKPYPVPVQVPHPVSVPHPVIVKKLQPFLLEHGDLSGGYVGLGSHQSAAVDYSYEGLGDGYAFTGSSDGVYTQGGYH